MSSKNLQSNDKKSDSVLFNKIERDISRLYLENESYPIFVNKVKRYISSLGVEDKRFSKFATNCALACINGEEPDSDDLPARPKNKFKSLRWFLSIPILGIIGILPSYIDIPKWKVTDGRAALDITLEIDQVSGTLIYLNDSLVKSLKSSEYNFVIKEINKSEYKLEIRVPGFYSKIDTVKIVQNKKYRLFYKNFIPK